MLLHAAGVDFQDLYFALRGSVDVPRTGLNECINCISEILVTLMRKLSLDLLYRLIGFASLNKELTAACGVQVNAYTFLYH